MDHNVEQHHAFLLGLGAWTQYTSNCTKKESSEKLDAAKFAKIIDGFAPVLVAHLTEEIQTLLALDKYDMDVLKKAWGAFDKYMLSDSDTVSSLFY